MNTKPIVLVGKMASGKTTIAKILETYGFLRIITCTTRPMRKGEIEGTDYYFMSDEKFLNLMQKNMFAETTDYDAKFGHVYYGSFKDSYKNNTVIVLNPKGVSFLIKNNIKINSFYLDVPEDILRQRAINRGDDINEIDRRLKKDNDDFKNIYSLCNHVISYNQISNFDSSQENTAKAIAKEIIMLSK